ncbi:Alpha-1,3-mannosyl-glycoprotein 2-beta-N-acetylglucosaminyltransferase [Capsicum chinense]|nr:Alpha-1,3-mannosyl-glycoprotein 2-beta-N-acetylglucosaminyltransferase [Capsicum chinense]
MRHYRTNPLEKGQLGTGQIPRCGAIAHLLRVIPMIEILSSKKEFIPTPNVSEVDAVFDVSLEMFSRSILVVSSWNDNGERQFVQDPCALYHSNFFPGLEWMLSRSTWAELSPK